MSWPFLTLFALFSFFSVIFPDTELMDETIMFWMSPFKSPCLWELQPETLKAIKTMQNIFS
jgi:hypothetical protein